VNLFQEYQKSLQDPDFFKKRYIENNFSYAAYDFLDDKKDSGEYSQLKKEYPLEIQQLEKIAENCFNFENPYTGKFLKNFIKNEDYDVLGKVYSIYRLYEAMKLEKNSS
jgi:hypothetical protein